MKKINNNEFIPIEDIAWISFRVLFEIEKDFSINELTRQRYNEIIKGVLNMKRGEKNEFVKRWLKLPYIYKGDLRFYEENTNNK